MTQLGENDRGLTDAVDQLGRILSGVLRAAFLASAAPQRTKAARILEQFDNAARKVRTVPKRVSNTNTFNIRASRIPEWKSLLGRLPTVQRSRELRRYYEAKAALLSVNRNIGSQIVRHTAGEGAPVTAKQSGPSVVPFAQG